MFLFCFIDEVYYINFGVLSQPCIPGINPTWVMCIILFMYHSGFSLLVFCSGFLCLYSQEVFVSVCAWERERVDSVSLASPECAWLTSAAHWRFQPFGCCHSYLEPLSKGEEGSSKGVLWSFYGNLGVDKSQEWWFTLKDNSVLPEDPWLNPIEK